MFPLTDFSCRISCFLFQDIMKRNIFIGFGFMILVVTVSLLIASQSPVMDTIRTLGVYHERSFVGKLKTGQLTPDDSHSPAGSFGNPQCQRTKNRSQYVYLRVRGGRTGSTLFQIYCLLALTNKFCYKAIIDPKNTTLLQTIQPFFDIANVEIDETVNGTTFQQLYDVLSDGTQKQLSYHLTNWTLKDHCYGYDYIVGQEKFIRSSIRFKEGISRVLDEYMNTFFENRTTVVVHVRRTDRVNHPFKDNYEYRSLEWYVPYISKAMSYLKERHSNLAFIFCSDDIKWCMDKFQGKDIYFSPFNSPGYDLALIAHCDHMIFTLGAFAWHGAWLGRKETVIYSKNYLPRRYRRPVFIYPWWTGL